MTSNAFATLIAQAETREATQQQLHQEQSEARKAAAQAYQAQQAAAARVQMLRSFGHNFLDRVARRVVKAKWSSSYIRTIQAYSQGLLSVNDVELPKIEAGFHVDAIHEQFENALDAFPEVPEGYFYGQRQLAERETTSTEAQPRIHYTAPPPKAQAPAEDTPDATVTELKPAFTPKGTKGGRVQVTPAIVHPLHKGAKAS